MLRTWISDELRTRKQGFVPRQDHEPLSSSVICQEKSAVIDAMAAAGGHAGSTACLDDGVCPNSVDGSAGT